MLLLPHLRDAGRPSVSSPRAIHEIPEREEILTLSQPVSALSEKEGGSGALAAEDPNLIGNLKSPQVLTGLVGQPGFEPGRPKGDKGF